MHDLDDWVLRLDELRVSGNVDDLRLSDGERMVSVVGERDIELAENEDGEQKTRLEGERIFGERDVGG